MPRPTDKAQLLSEIQKEHSALVVLLARLTPDQMTVPGTVGEWAVKDVLVHLTEWEQMCLNWYTTGKRGETPKTPAEDLSWRQIPELNQRIFETHRDQPLEEVLSRFNDSSRQIFEAIQAMTEEELFTPKFYKWTNTTTLGSYMTSATCSHYLWARKEIRKGLETL
jgi:uncharacterized protein (TIGR03083 family)